MNFRFTHLRLENWRNFRRVEVDLQQRVFVSGPNAAGKTNLIDALRFLRDIALPEGSLAKAVKERGGISHLRSLHTHAHQARTVTVAVRLAIGSASWSYELVLAGGKNQPPRVERERVMKGGQELLTRPNDADRADKRLLEQTHLEQLTQNAKFRELVDALAAVATVHVVPQVARGELRGAGVPRDAPGSDFIERLAGLSEKKRKAALGRLAKLLKVAVPQFSQLRIDREPGTGRAHLEANYQHWRSNGVWQNEQEFSDGTLRLIGMLWSILDGDTPLLLEEPELSLHSEVVRQLPRLLARAAERHDRQVIVTTHAEEMLDDAGIDPSEVLILVTTGQETEVRVASEDPEIRQARRASIPLARAITSRTKPTGIDQLSLALGDPGAP